MPSSVRRSREGSEPRRIAGGRESAVRNDSRLFSFVPDILLQPGLISEDTGKNPVDIPQLAFERERLRDLLGGKYRPNLGIGFYRRAKVPLFLPGPHGMTLNDPIGF